MSQEAVYLAWGGPDQRMTSQVQGQAGRYVGLHRDESLSLSLRLGPGFLRARFHGYGYYGVVEAATIAMDIGGFYDPFFYSA